MSRSRNNNSLFWTADASRLAGRFMFLTEPTFPTSLWVTLRKLEKILIDQYVHDAGLAIPLTDAIAALIEARVHKMGMPKA